MPQSFATSLASGAAPTRTRGDAATERIERDHERTRPQPPTTSRRSARDFPILSQQVYGKPLVYLDNAASAQKPRAVIDAHGRTPWRRTTPTSIAACTIWPTPRPKPTRAHARPCARSSTPARPTRSSSRASATEAINLVAASLRRAWQIGEGDEIILSIMEHHSNIVPWHFLRERQGAVIKWAPVDDDGNFLARRVREAAHAAHQDRRASPTCRTCSARSTPIAEIVAHRPRARRPGAGRRQPGRGPPAGRRAGARLRFLRLHRPQGLRPDRHRRALRQDANGWSALPPYQGGGEMIGDRHARTRSPTTTRRTASRPARRRSSRRSASAPRSTT